MLVPNTAPYLTALCVALAVGTASAQAQDRPTRIWQELTPVSNRVLEQARASGRAVSVDTVRTDIAVILWDEPKTPRPGGGGNGTVTLVSVHAPPPPLQAP